MKLIDLTHGLDNGIPGFPGDPEFKIVTAHHYENGYFVSEVTTSTHSGTHLDAPIHNIPGARSLSDMALEEFCAEKAVVIDCRALDGEVDAAFLEANKEKIQGCEAVLFRSGWSDQWTGDFFGPFPGLNEDAAPALTALGVRMIGLETPSVNAQRHATVHTALLSEKIVIVESLCGLENLPETPFTFFAMPLPLIGRDGSPVRAFAMV